MAVAEPLRQPQALLDIEPAPTPPGDEVLDWLRLIADGVGALLYNQQVIHRLLLSVSTKEDAEMADLSRIQQAVANATTVQESAITLLSALAQEIRDNATDQNALNQLADSVDAEAGKLADSITQNTPQAPPQP